MSGNEVADRETAPFVIEGHGEGALRIHFESEHNRREYLKILPRRPAPCSLNLYKGFEDDETILWD
jgi:hypothetical protein